MSRSLRTAAPVLGAMILALALPLAAGAQRHAVPRPPSPPHPHSAAVVRGQIFIGGYFYDPMFGPYPWWARNAYPRWYFPLRGQPAELRVMVSPREAAVYVDGFYAGIVNDFDGVFQRLRLPPGGHAIDLYLEGYETAHHNLYLRPDSTLKLHDTLSPLPADVRSEPPVVAAPVPAPPRGSYSGPRTPPPPSVPTAPAPSATASRAVGFGMLDLRVQPLDATVEIDGKRWQTSDPGHFAVQVPVGRHRVAVRKSGFSAYQTQIEVHDSSTMPLNVSLMAAGT